MKAVLVDTDVLIDFLRGNSKARDFLIDVSDGASVYCSAVTVAELHAGMRDAEERATNDLIAGCVLVAVTREIAERAGRLKRQAKGHTLELDDCLIGASAMQERAVLATGNAKHYPFDGLKVVVPEYRGG